MLANISISNATKLKHFQSSVLLLNSFYMLLTPQDPKTTDSYELRHPYTNQLLSRLHYLSNPLHSDGMTTERITKRTYTRQDSASSLVIFVKVINLKNIKVSIKQIKEKVKQSLRGREEGCQNREKVTVDEREVPVVEKGGKISR